MLFRLIARHTQSADIVIAAVGQTHFLKPEMVKTGAVILDVGITRVGQKLVGDVDPKVCEKVGWFAPMPGGVGPMTRAMLLQNVVELAQTK